MTLGSLPSSLTPASCPKCLPPTMPTQLLCLYRCCQGTYIVLTLMLKLQPRRREAASPAPMVQALENPVRAEETKDRRLLHWPHPTPTTVPKPTAKSQRLPSAYRSTPCIRRATTRHKSEKASKLRTQNLNVYHFPIEINLEKKKSWTRSSCVRVPGTEDSVSLWM